jgi:PAS domain-containing protein
MNGGKDKHGRQHLRKLQKKLLERAASRGPNIVAFEGGVERRRARQRIVAEQCGGAFVKDALGRTIYVTQQLERLYGCTSIELLGDGWLRRAADDAERERIGAAWAHAVSVGASYREIVRSARFDTGETFMTEVYAVPLRDRDGVLLEYRGWVRPMRRAEDWTGRDASGL